MSRRPPRGPGSALADAYRRFVHDPTSGPVYTDEGVPLGRDWFLDVEDPNSEIEVMVSQIFH